MSSTLTRVLSGIVGVSPGMVLLQTNLTNSDIQNPGFLNQLETMTDVQVQPTDFVFANASDGSEYYTLQVTGINTLTLVPAGGSGGGTIENIINVGSGTGIGAGLVGTTYQLKTLLAGTNVTLSSTGTTVTINANGGGGGGFQYQQTWWVAQNGNDSNAGNSIDTPFLTIGQAIASFTGNRNVINIPDEGVYNLSGSFHVAANTIVTINAPAASIVGDGANIPFTLGANSVLNLDLYLLNAAGPAAISAGTQDAIANVYIQSVINASTLNTGEYNGTRGYVGQNGLDFNSGGILLLTGPVSGQSYELLPDSAGDYFVNPTTGNKMLLMSFNGGTIHLPSVVSFPQIEEGFRMYFNQLNKPSDGQVGRFFLQAAGDVISNNAVATLPGICELVLAIKGDAGNGFVNTWTITGDVAFAGSSFAVYVSQISGDDTAGNGTLEAPWATFGFAISQVGTPVNPTVIIGLDGETYNESITLASTGVSIVAPQAVLTSTTGDVITCTTSSGLGNLVNVGEIVRTSTFNSVHCTGTSGMILNINAIIGPIVTNTGNINITTDALMGNLTTGSGTINYFAQNRSGTNTGNINGLTPEGSTTPTFTVNALIADGLTYPTADGTNGQAMVTNGSGLLSFATVGGGGGLSFNTIAGTSQLAVAANAYICANAAQTTVTLPAVSAVGDTVRVYGQGAAGWILQAAGGQTINLGTASTSTGGTLTSAANTDLVEVTCLVANTLWQVNFVYSTGLTVA